MTVLYMSALLPTGMTVWEGGAVDTQAGISGHALLDAVGAAEREVAASASQEPMGEWECVRVRPSLEGGVGTSQAQLSTPAEAAAALQVGTHWPAR